MLKTKVYVKSVTNLTDARYCAGMMVDYIGFCVDRLNDNYVSPEKFNEIKNWLVGIKIVAELAEAPIEVLKEYTFDALLINDGLVLDMLGNKYTYFSENKYLAKKVNYFIGDDENATFKAFDSIEELKKIENFTFGVVLQGSEEERPGFKNMDTLTEMLEYLEA